MKKILLGLFGIITLGLINFSSAINCATETTYTATSDGYLLITQLQGNNIDNNTYVNFDSKYHKQKVYLINDTYGYGYKLRSVNEGTTHEFWQLFKEGDIITISPTSNITRCLVDFIEKDIIQNDSCSPGGQCSVSDKVSENIIFSGSKSFTTSYSNMFNYGNEGAGTYCMKFTSSNAQTLTMGFANGPTTTPTNLYSLYADQYGNTICLYGNKPYLNVKLNSSSNTIDYEVYKLTDLLSDDIPCGSSSESSQCESDLTTCQGNLTTCQGMYDRLDSDYDLLEGNYNTCTTELNSCLQNGGTSGSGDIQWSSLFINNVQHLGNKNIYITIPEYINYSYSNEGESFEFEVVGLEQDEEYLSGVINKQNYIPTSEDLSNVFSNFGLFGSLLVVCLFVILVFYFIKKIFS